LYIPDEIIEDIRSASDIIDIISDFVILKKQGRNFGGLCPFHSEKTPSFMVSPDKQIYRCFGCGEGGNVFSFLMKKENLSFPDAARLLAEKAGIAIPETENPVRDAQAKEQKAALEINDLTSSFYQYILKKHESAEEARSYIQKRGLALATVNMFQIGFAPPGWDNLLQFLNKKGHQVDVLEKCGLVLPGTKGQKGYYDRFRNRIMFPIWNVQGKVVGFGGRVMDDSMPKYLNSPETFLFNKGHLLYGINKAVESIRLLDQVIIVEGYLDVITCHQAGINNVVASLGTAFTREQGKLLLRYTREVIIAYDTDAAGVNATLKGWQILDDMGFRVKIVSIPDGKDPDEFIRNNGADAFLEVIRQNSLSLCDYKTERAMDKYDIYSLEGKFKIASEVIPSIKNLSSEIEKEEAIMKLAQKLHLSPNAIRAEVGKNPGKSRKNWGKRDKITGFRDNNSEFFLPEKAPVEEKDARIKAEETLLAVILEEKKVFLEVKGEIGVHFGTKKEYVNIINLLNEIAINELDYQPAVFFDQLDDESTKGVLSLLLMKDTPTENREKIIQDCLNVIKDDEIRKKREDLLRRMEEADKNKDYALSKQLLLVYSKLI
jgi:DNA primase